VAAGDHEIVASDDLVLVAELAGHRRLETTRRYTSPRGLTARRVADRPLDF
jgi:site-specific recombinase XerC